MDSHIQEHGGINGVSFQGLARTDGGSVCGGAEAPVHVGLGEITAGVSGRLES